MVNVLCIGQYDKTGKFTKNQWYIFIEWCKEECGKIIVYSRMPYNIIKSKFQKYCIINQLGKPDETLDIYTYEINVVNFLFWDYIKNYNYNIDVDDISHIYFFNNEKYIASLEIVDYENYILLDISTIQERKLLQGDDSLILENIQLCSAGKADIDELLREEVWKPLGKF